MGRVNLSFPINLSDSRIRSSSTGNHRSKTPHSPVSQPWLSVVVLVVSSLVLEEDTYLLSDFRSTEVTGDDTDRGLRRRSPSRYPTPWRVVTLDVSSGDTPTHLLRRSPPRTVAEGLRSSSSFVTLSVKLSFTLWTYNVLHYLGRFTIYIENLSKTQGVIDGTTTNRDCRFLFPDQSLKGDCSGGTRGPVTLESDIKTAQDLDVPPLTQPHPTELLPVEGPSRDHPPESGSEGKREVRYEMGEVGFISTGTAESPSSLLLEGMVLPYLFLGVITS